MKALFYQTYIIALPIILTALLGYIVWLLQEQKKQKAIDTVNSNPRIPFVTQDSLFVNENPVL